MELILDKKQTMDVVTMLDNYGFMTSDIEDALDNIFNGYLWSQHKNGSENFREAQNYHYTIIEVKKLLRAVAESAKEAQLKNEQS